MNFSPHGTTKSPLNETFNISLVLSTLRDLVLWLAERDQVSSAITLASEWFTSWAIIQLDSESEHLTDHNHRGDYADALYFLSTELSTSAPKNDHTSEKAKNYARLLIARYPLTSLEGKDKTANIKNAREHPLKEICSLLIKTRDLRNDLNHAGINQSPAKSANLILASKDIAKRIQTLPLKPADLI